jgi:hypothetical protein
MPSLLVFLKHPVAGKVKTRLAASVGSERAAALYRQWIGLVFARLQPLRSWVHCVSCSDGAPLQDFPWLVRRLAPHPADIDTWEDWLFHCPMREGTYEETCF